MLRKNLLAAIVLAVSMLTGFAAQANLIYIGYSVNGGAITQVAVSDGVAFGFGVDGAFSFTGQGTGAPVTDEGTLLTLSLSMSASTAGTVTVYVSEVDNDLQAGSFTTGFGNNSLSSISILEQTYVSAGNTPFDTTGTLLASMLVAPGAATPDTTVAAPGGLGVPYTLTAVYTFDFSGPGFATGSLNVTAAVPEPTTLALLGAGLLGLGLVSRRKTKKTADLAAA